MKYFEEAKHIWQSQVPKSGQADTVDGELIRAVEKLRHEAQNNGNMNWDEGFEMFCSFLWETLNDGTFDDLSLAEIQADIATLQDGDTPHLDDELYDRLADRAVEWSLAHNGPVKREKDPAQYR